MWPFSNTLNVFLVGLLVNIAQPVNTEARAQESQEQLQKFTHSRWYQDYLAHVFGAIPEAVFKKCPTLVSKGSRIVVIKSTSFGSSGFPNSGTWKQMFPVSGCGNDTVLNFYFSAGADEKINSVFGAPGATRGDLVLQHDAYFFASVGASSVIKDCKPFQIKNTRFNGFGIPRPPTPDPGPNDPLRPWWETWSMIGCGRTVDVPLYFIPNGKGITITQPVGDVIER